MLKKVTLVALVLALVALPGFSRTVNNKNLPDNYALGKDNLVINGAGQRIKKVAFVNVKVYACSVYLKAKNSNANAIVNADEPMVFKIHITSGAVTSDKFKNALDEGFAASTGNNVAPYLNDINTFKGFFANPIKEDHVFDLEYIPGTGVVSKINGKAVGTIKGLAFKKILFGIWLGPNAVQPDLKAALIGG